MPRPTEVRLNLPARQPPPAPVGARLRVVEQGDPRVTLVKGDNLAALGALAESSRGTFTLAYLDPPFLTQRRHPRVVREPGRAGSPGSRREEEGFDDRWTGGLTEWLGCLADRVTVARELLAPHGSLVLHVDSKTSHYAKVLLDEIFGGGCFVSEIVWRYRRWPAKTSNFQRVHDVLLRWVRDPKVRPRFTQLYEPLAASTRATWGDTRQRAVVEGGRRARSSATEEPTPGVPLGDVWDIGIVAPVARERTGWPTQKPEALLERLMAACTAPGDRVLDPYLGSGTTLAVAHRLGRPGVGIDHHPAALACAEHRLRAAGARPHVLSLDVAPRRARRRGEPVPLAS